MTILNFGVKKVGPYFDILNIFFLDWIGLQNMKPGYHRIGSVHAVIWQAGTNWTGPLRIQIYYGPECRIEDK